MNDYHYYLEKIKNILSKPENIKALNNNNFEHIYEDIRNYPSFYPTLIPRVTEMFYKVDLNPLLYMKEIPEYFLSNSKGTTQINIPANIKIIKWQAFFNTSITNLIIPEGVESIGSEAFSSCESLVNISLPSTLKIVLIGSFRACPNITTIKYAGTKEKFKHIFDDKYSLNYKIFITCQDGKMKYRKLTEEWVDID